MTTLMMILGGVLIGLGVGLMKSTPSDKKPWKPKKKRHIRKDDFWDILWLD